MFNSFDVETVSYENKLVPYCVSFYNNDTTQIFYGINCIDDFINFIFKKAYEWNENNKDPMIIFSHNLTFDGSILIQNLSKHDIKFNGLFFKGNIYYIKIS